MANLAVALACPNPLLSARAVWLSGVADHSPIPTCFRVRACDNRGGALLPMRKIYLRAARDTEKARARQLAILFRSHHRRS